MHDTMIFYDVTLRRCLLLRYERERRECAARYAERRYERGSARRFADYAMMLCGARR